MESKGSESKKVFYLQVRVSYSMKKKLLSLSESAHRPMADIIRASLYFGVPMLEHILEMEHSLNKLVIKTLPNYEKPKGAGFPKGVFDKFF